MKLTFMGATETVTGSKYYLQSNQDNFLIDCGLFQGHKPLRRRNWEPLPIDPTHIKSVLLTHAHLDHTGYLPLLVKNGFEGKIYATKATRDLCSLLLPDSGYLQEEDARRANKYGYSKHKVALPLYTKMDALKSLKQFHIIERSTHYQLSQEIEASWYRAGHILGSSFIVCKENNTSILFSGDMGRHNDPLMKPLEPPPNVDYIVLESTYGDRLHEKEAPEILLKKMINDTVNRGGSIVIPSFAVGRAQSLLYYLYQLKINNEIPDVPIYLDSPMAISATDFMCHNAKEHKLTPEHWSHICSIAQYTQTPEESKKINENSMPKIIISASGMATGGRVLHHLKHYAPSHRNTILFAGFQAGGTRGDKILHGAKTIRIHGMDVPVEAQVENLSNISAHADYKEILHWLSAIHEPPRHIFITHGELNASLSLKEKIENQFGFSCSVPKYLDSETL